MIKFILVVWTQWFAGFAPSPPRAVETLSSNVAKTSWHDGTMALRGLVCAAGLLGTAHSILHELNPTNPEHHEQIKTLLEDCQLLFDSTN